MIKNVVTERQDAQNVREAGVRLAMTWAKGRAWEFEMEGNFVKDGWMPSAAYGLVRCKLDGRYFYLPRDRADLVARKVRAFMDVNDGIAESHDAAVLYSGILNILDRNN